MTASDEIAMAFGKLALKAGQAIMHWRGAEATAKSDGSPVTAADLASDRCIREGLAHIAPGLAVVTEEAMETHRAHPGRFILVDPLDGTREFVAGRDEFTVNIAVIADGVPIAGTVYAPALSRLYVGGTRAWRADVAPGQAMPSPDAMVKIAAKPLPPDNWRAVASRSHLDAETERWLASHPIGERCAAGSSLKLCLIAEGNADVYPRLSPTKEWDIAAGHAILRAAGGEVRDLAGLPLRYGKHDADYFNPAFVAWGRRASEETS